MVWIYVMPTWLFMSSAVVGSCLLAAGLLALWRARISRNEQITHNDVAGPILTTIGTVLAVLMSFMVLGVWQEYDSAAQTVQHEASSAADLHHLADAFPMPMRLRIHESVDRYLELVIKDEWPRMRRGGESIAAHDAAYHILALLAHWSPRDPVQQLLQSRSLELAGSMLDARRDRILSNRQGIPSILWATLLLCGFLTVIFSFYFRVDKPHAQYIMVVALTAIIALTFTLIAELDFPFRGDVALQPFAFEHILKALHGTFSAID